MMDEQKFHFGDHVQVAEDLGSSMSHFPKGIDAIVMGSYDDEYSGPRNSTATEHHYKLFIRGHGEVSWYYEHQLTLIGKGCYSLLGQWKNSKDNEAKIDEDDCGGTVDLNKMVTSLAAFIKANCHEWIK